MGRGFGHGDCLFQGGVEGLPDELSPLHGVSLDFETLCGAVSEEAGECSWYWLPASWLALQTSVSQAAERLVSHAVLL